MPSFVDRILRRARERHFLFAARGILDTPPLAPRDDGVVLFSMIGTRVLRPYLAAVKSLDHFLGRGRAAILDDGTLTERDKAVLREQLGNPEIFSAAQVDTKGCPTYSSWKRLFTLLELRRENYVIQLDSDTITIGEVPLVAEMVAAGRSFILRGEPGVEFSDLKSISEQARRNPWFTGKGDHVQLAMEAAMEGVAIPGREGLRYARGCAGFAGFAPDPEGTRTAELFSAEASRLLGFDHWKQWGSEQVTSNFLIANEAGSQLLPYDHYCNFWNEQLDADMRFVHFIGTYRYHKGLYASLTRRMIARLNGG